MAPAELETALSFIREALHEAAAVLDTVGPNTPAEVLVTTRAEVKHAIKQLARIESEVARLTEERDEALEDLSAERDAKEAGRHLREAAEAQVARLERIEEAARAVVDESHVRASYSVDVPRVLIEKLGAELTTEEGGDRE